MTLLTNYRPVSILCLISKVYERLIYYQQYEFAENILNSVICGFRKAHSAHNMHDLSYYNRGKKK